MENIGTICLVGAIILGVVVLTLIVRAIKKRKQ